MVSPVHPLSPPPLSPPPHCHSTHHPPHEQLLTRLVVSGVSFGVPSHHPHPCHSALIMSLPVVPSSPHHCCHPSSPSLLLSPPCHHLSSPCHVVVFILIPLIISFPHSSSSLLVCPCPHHPLISPPLCFVLPTPQVPHTLYTHHEQLLTAMGGVLVVISL
jgi:hypothetical protein